MQSAVTKKLNKDHGQSHPKLLPQGKHQIAAYQAIKHLQEQECANRHIDSASWTLARHEATAMIAGLLDCPNAKRNWQAGQALDGLLARQILTESDGHLRFSA